MDDKDYLSALEFQMQEDELENAEIAASLFDEDIDFSKLIAEAEEKHNTADNNNTEKHSSIVSSSLSTQHQPDIISSTPSTENGKSNEVSDQQWPHSHGSQTESG